ncbi:MAG: hypothetical protein NTX84_04785 [Nitrospirae bacterium]|nr:hypothetical protein [Nitrospirota bacterium]
MKKRVLFVLANPSDIATMKAMVAPLSGEWEMEFVLKKEEALAVVAQSTVDVILASIYLTGMGALQLLTEVKEQAPYVIRILFRWNSSGADGGLQVVR